MKEIIWLETFDDGMNEGKFKFAVNETWLLNLLTEWSGHKSRAMNILENIESLDLWQTNEIYEVASKNNAIIDCK